ncbi:hypothetical protein ACIQF6_28515 [Kitasatospora sp. NPDC092948]|uniref:hypothetical protein n=1 Tax=Kitasatospora sp. NPDC092948 TaxID=3364088 RepID=UPI0037F93D9D
MHESLPAPQVPRFLRSGPIGLLRAGKGVFALVGLGVSGAVGLLGTLQLTSAAIALDRLYFWLAVRAGRWGYRAACLDGTVTTALPGPDDSVYLAGTEDGPFDGTSPVLLDRAREDHLTGRCCPDGAPIEGCRLVQDAVLAADPDLLDQAEEELMRRFAALDVLLADESESPR